jgi:hypothetical protein
MEISEESYCFFLISRNLLITGECDKNDVIFNNVHMNLGGIKLLMVAHLICYNSNRHVGNCDGEISEIV